MPYYSQDMIGGAMNASHIYYNINISNDYSGYETDLSGNITQVDTNTKELQLVFNQSRAQPYLINPSKYFLSVQRFTIESPNLPVFICQPIVGQGDINKSIYSITIERESDGALQTLNVSWQPDDKSVPVPSGTVTTSWQTNPYYYCYSYQHFIDLINNTFTEFLTTSFISGLGVTQPYMYFDTKTHLATVGGNVITYRTTTQGAYLGNGAGYKIYFNIELYNLFSSLKAIYKGTTGPVVGADYQLVMDTGSNTIYASLQNYIVNWFQNPRNNTTGGVDTTDVINTQEYSTLPLWTPIKNIVFRTTLLNVAPDIVGTPIVFEQGDLNINSGKSNTDILNIMIDHTVPLTIGTEYRPFIYFEPVGEFRLVELYGNQPINSMDIAVFWKDSFGNLIPFVLDIGASATIKLLFRKKTFNSDKI
jgi:hypothetical protein